MHCSAAPSKLAPECSCLRSYQLENLSFNHPVTPLCVVSDAYLSGDERLLKRWCSRSAYAVVFAAMKERTSLGITVDNTVLDITDMEVVAAKVFEKQAPILVCASPCFFRW